MSVSGQITVGRGGRHVRYSEVMSGSVDTFSLGRTKQSRRCTAGHDEPVSCHLRRRRRVRKARLSGMIFINKLLRGP